MDSESCIYCHRDSNVVPLIHIEYKKQPLCICAEHMPILIHNPGMLSGKLEEVEDLKASDND